MKLDIARPVLLLLPVFKRVGAAASDDLQVAAGVLIVLRLSLLRVRELIGSSHSRVHDFSGADGQSVFT